MPALSDIAIREPEALFWAFIFPILISIEIAFTMSA